MAQRYYEQGNTGTYVLELEGDFTDRDKESMQALEKTVNELSKNPELKRLIIYQKGSVQIDTAGLGQVVGLCASLYQRKVNPVKASFVGLDGAFYILFERCKIGNVFEKYDTLEEAIKTG